MKRNIKELISAMKKIKGEDAEISIFHKLYGEQKLRTILNPIISEYIGFIIQKQEIYIEREKINKVCLENGICFADDVMEIRIKTE